MRPPLEDVLPTNAADPDPPVVGQVYALHAGAPTPVAWEVLHADAEAVTAIRADGEPRVVVLSASEWRRRRAP